MIEFIFSLYLVIGFGIGVGFWVQNFDKNNYIYNREKGVDKVAVLMEMPGASAFIVFTGVGWGIILLFFFLEYMGWISPPYRRMD